MQVYSAAFVDVELALVGASPPGGIAEPFWILAGQRFSVRVTLTLRDASIAGVRASMQVQYGRDVERDQALLPLKVGASSTLSTFPRRGPAHDECVPIRIVIEVDGHPLGAPLTIELRGER